MTLDASHAGGADIGNLAKLLPRIRVGNMYLDGRDTDGLDRIQQSDARVRVGTGVDHDAVRRAMAGQPDYYLVD